MSTGGVIPSIFAGDTPRFFSIEPGRPFLHDLARILIAQAGDTPLALADFEIFLPTRRAVRSLREAFIAAAPKGKASLLPCIRPLGDIDEDEFVLEEEAGADDAIDLPPAVSSLERRLQLARLVAAAERAFAGQENWPAALAASKELAALLDSFYAEEIDFSALHSLAPAQHAKHWDRSLKFLQIATSAWPAHLEGVGRMDPSARRAKLIDLQTKRLEKTRPDTPVIIAGTTGSAPAVARLMGVVARLPKGAVVLPGLDRALAQDEKAWRAIEDEDAHPQAGLKALLERLDVSPADVRSWPIGKASPRSRLLSLALRPASATDDWREMVAEARAADPGLARAGQGLSLVVAPDEEAEANAIALMLREALETPRKTAMLVTPDRNLSRRVAAKMRRWEVIVDDSAGIPFANSPCGTYLRLVSAWMANPSDPAAAIALAQHPLAGFAISERERRRALAAFNKAVRGLTPKKSADGLRERVSKSHHAAIADPFVALLEKARTNLPATAEASFSVHLSSLIATAEMLAANDEEDGAERLWRGEDGEAGAMLLADLGALANALGEISTNDFVPAFAQMIAGAAVRRRAPAHPRLSILGPLEARLQSADLVILGGLNEGVWPGEAASDPFLSRPMRKEIGLPSAERRIGLAAHDFAQLAAAKNVILTRAERSGGAPAKPSRWIVRLRNILEGAQVEDCFDDSKRYAAWMAALDKPAHDMTPASAPAPRPPVAMRPRKLSVTRIEKWLRDPYSIYGRYILRLRKLDALNEPFNAAHLGSLIHKTFEEYARAGGDIREIFGRHAPDYGYGPAEVAFYAPSVSAALAWFEEFHAERLKIGTPLILEREGEISFDAPFAPFTLTARADRIDLTNDGKAAIFDYKSKSIPSKNQIALFRVQLPLTAFIVAEGGFRDLGKREIEEFYYIRALARNGKDDERGASGQEANNVMTETIQGLKEWIAAFDNPDTPYLSQPRAEFVDDYGDYDLLARRREWSIGGEEE